MPTSSCASTARKSLRITSRFFSLLLMASSLLLLSRLSSLVVLELSRRWGRHNLLTSRCHGLRWQIHTPRSHRKHDAELGLAAHHAGVGFAGFGERILFNHGAHAGQFGEAERVFRVGGDSCRPALDVRPALDGRET